MAIGKVKWFNNAKGFGFIVPDDGGDDIFAHYSTIQMEGYRSLKAGQEVKYEVQQGPRGYMQKILISVESQKDKFLSKIKKADINVCFFVCTDITRLIRKRSINSLRVYRSI